jgi:hypothetical protein
MLTGAEASSAVVESAHRAHRSAWLWWAPATGALALLGVALRLPFVDAPLTADEGGYAEVARLWAHGERLYQGAWVDRPQGLVVVFRAALGAGLTSVYDLRALAAAFGALLVVLAALLGKRSGGWGRGLFVAAMVATAGASPFLESFTLNGELIAGVAAVAAILAFGRCPPGGRAWLVVSGLCAGSAWMVKQSAVDAAVAIGVCLVLRREKAGNVALFAVAVAAPVAVGVVASGDPGAWYGAVIGYGLHASGPGTTLLERWTLFRHSVGPAAKALGPVAVLAAIGWRHAPVLARAWLAAAVLGVLLGGGFHTHYYLQLVVPLAFVAAFMPLSERLLAVTAAGAAAVTLGFAASLWAATDVAQARAIWPVDSHLRSDAAVAAFLRAHTRPSQRVYVLWAAADLYYLSDRRPALRYLWLRNVQTIHGVVATVQRMLDERTPALVVAEQAPSRVDASGRTASALQRNYRLAARIDGVDVYSPRR